MNKSSATLSTAIIVFAFATSVPALSLSPFQEQQKSVQLPTAELEAFNAIKAAPNAAAKLTLAEEFVKKFPKSKARTEVAGLVASEIVKTKDVTEATTLAEKAGTIFTTASEREIISPVLLDAYVAANRVDDAFKLAGQMLGANPDDLHVLLQMTFMGTEQAKQKNVTHAPQTLQYGARAIELIEANKKPTQLDEARWTRYKSSLPQVYQQTAILNLIAGNPAEAKTRLAKAIELSPNDPYSFALLGFLLNDEYTKLVPAFQAMPEGKPKEEEKKRLEGIIDTIIDNYAHVAATAAGHPEYQELIKQVVPDLTSYYKYRHNNSTEGLQELIDKYKPKP
jgi:tetratricopeptide (TPR) repeat protein